MSDEPEELMGRLRRVEAQRDAAVAFILATDAAVEHQDKCAFYKEKVAGCRDCVRLADDITLKHERLNMEMRP